MIPKTRVTDTPLIHFTCHGEWDERWGEGGGARNGDPHIENYSNIIINMHKV